MANKAQSRSYQVPKTLFFGLQISQKLLPTLSFKRALKLFFTPTKFDTPEREVSYKNRANLNRALINGKRITIYQTGKGKKSVLFVHGWGGRSTQFFQMAEMFEKAGFSVYSFTAPAHGSSNDGTTHMLEFAESIVHLDKMYGPFELIAGHSLGGMAIMNALNMGVQPNKIAMIGTPSTITHVLNDFCEGLKLNKAVREKFINYLKTTYSEDFEQYSTLRLAENCQLPTLVIHDENDLDVAINQAQDVADVLKNGGFIKTQGLGHRRILSDPQVIQQLIEFATNEN